MRKCNILAFFKIFNKPCVPSLRVWTKNPNCWKFWENFRKFSKFFLRNLLICIILAYVTKALTNHLLLLCAFWWKTQIVGKCWENLKIFDENSIEKLLFYFFIFWKFVTKNRAFGNHTIFLRQFFRFRRGGVSPTPCLRPFVASCSRKSPPLSSLSFPFSSDVSTLPTSTHAMFCKNSKWTPNQGENELNFDIFLSYSLQKAFFSIEI